MKKLCLFMLAALPLSLGCSRKDAAKAGQVVVWHWLTDRDDALQKLADDYQKIRSFPVHLELYAPSDAYSSRVRAAAQTNTLPDIFGVLGETRDLASFIKSGHILNLNEAMNANRSAWKNQFFSK